MPYTRHMWSGKQTCTNELMNNIEDGIEEAMQSGGGGYDAEISITDPYQGSPSASIINGTYADLVSLISDNIAPSILVRIWSESSTFGYTKATTSAVAIYEIGIDLSVDPRIRFAVSSASGGYYYFNWYATDEIGF